MSLLDQKMAVESKFIEEVLYELTDVIGGDWLLAGGALVCLEFDANRATEDLDIAYIRSQVGTSKEAALSALYKKLIENGSGPEWVNTAVEAFLNEITDWKNHIVKLRSGKIGCIYRPNLTLFVYLKLRRGTDIDIADVQAAFKKNAKEFDIALLSSWKNEKVIKLFEVNKFRFNI